MMQTREKKWWKEAVVYQVYPMSFYDSNGDGIGDLKGIIQKVDYIQQLGVDVIWLTPFFESPNHDNGYDISDYCAVGKQFGNMADFDGLIEQAHARGIKIVLDLVFNHTSDEHPWFLESRSSRAHPRRNYYYWRDGKNGREPNNWSGAFEPSCWTYDETTGQYYLHTYSKKMPDLNWENPAVRQEIYRVMKFWLGRGVDGFRFDSFNLIKKLTSFEDAVTPDPFAAGYYFDKEKCLNVEGIMDFVHEMHEEVLQGRELFTVGETTLTPPQIALQYVKENSKAINLVFNFEPVEMDPFDLEKFKDIQKRWYQMVEKGGNSCNFLSNHDLPRQVSKFGDDLRYRVDSAKLLGTLNLLLCGVPFIYQGEEIGMTNVRHADISHYDDLVTLHKYSQFLTQGMEPQAALEKIESLSRDNARTPMQWNWSMNAGFSKTTSWLPVNLNYPEINVEAELARPDGVLAHYRQLIAFRKGTPVVVYGDYNEVDTGNPEIYAFTRCLDDTELLVLLNFASSENSGTFNLNGYETCIDSHRDFKPVERFTLRPWQSVVLKRASVL